MEFDDIFENKRSHHDNYRKHRNFDSDWVSKDSQHSSHGHDNYMKWTNILGKIGSNRKLKLLAIVACLLILLVIICLLVVFLPLIVKLYNYFIQNGLQGIVDDINGMVDKILNGTTN